MSVRLFGAVGKDNEMVQIGVADSYQPEEKDILLLDRTLLIQNSLPRPATVWVPVSFRVRVEGVEGEWLPLNHVTASYTGDQPPVLVVEGWRLLRVEPYSPITHPQ